HRRRGRQGRWRSGPARLGDVLASTGVVDLAGVRAGRPEPGGEESLQVPLVPRGRGRRGPRRPGGRRDPAATHVLAVQAHRGVMGRSDGDRDVQALTLYSTFETAGVISARPLEEA